MATRLEGRIWVPNRCGSSNFFAARAKKIVNLWTGLNGGALASRGAGVGSVARRRECVGKYRRPARGLPLGGARPIPGPACRANRSARLEDERFSDPRMATLHHHPICPRSRFIRLVLGEIGLDVELKEERVWERRREFLALNPAGTTPVLSEESIAAVPGAAVIAEYLDETRGLALGD